MPRTVAAAMGMTVHDYLAYCDARPDQSFELIAGQPVAMSPATRGHQLVGGNIEYALRTRLRGRGCDVLRDFGMALSETSDFMPQPDVMVRCGPLDSDRRWAADPVVIVEVLSPSTAARDRGYKRARYCEVPSLRHLVFVAPRAIRVEAWHRDADGRWPDTPQVLVRRDDTLCLDAVGAGLPLAEIYLDLDP